MDCNDLVQRVDSATFAAYPDNGTGPQAQLRSWPFLFLARSAAMPREDNPHFEGHIFAEHKEALAKLKKLLETARDLVHDLEATTARTQALIDKPPSGNPPK
jgi:hypothetical protein